MDTIEFLLALAMSGDTQSYQENNEAEASREIETIRMVEKILVVVYCIVVVCQLVMSVIFYWRSRNIKEINWLPKFIMVLSNTQGITWSSYYIAEEIALVPVPAIIRFWLSIITTIIYPTMMGLLIRFQRVQVQLRAQEENTIKIL